MTLANEAKDNDNGQTPAALATNQTTNDNAPLRLRGGNDTPYDNMSILDMDIDTGDYSTNAPKRFKSKSPEPSMIAYGPIEDALNKVDNTISGIRTYLMDMTSATKIGKKWAAGMEEFLAEILIQTKKVAFEAVEVIGKNKNLSAELRTSREYVNDLSFRLGKRSNNGYEAETETRSFAETTKTQKAAVNDNPAVQQSSKKVNLQDNSSNLPSKITKKTGDFPPITKSGKKNKGSKIKRNPKIDKLEKAKKIPVKPTLRVKGTKGMDTLWKSIKEVLEKPRVDSARKLPSGDVIVVSTDTDTVKAIMGLNGKGGIDVTETGARKPKVKIKNIPSEYTPEFISSSLTEQNLDLREYLLNDINPIFKCGPKNRDVVDWVIEVTPKAYNAIVNRRTFIGMVSTFPRPYVSAPHCRRCLALDHPTKECTKDITCHHCAEKGHERKNCHNKEKTPMCLHCGEQHLTMAKVCRVWSQRLRAVQRTTDYGTSHLSSSHE